MPQFFLRNPTIDRLETGKFFFCYQPYSPFPLRRRTGGNIALILATRSSHVNRMNCYPTLNQAWHTSISEGRKNCALATWAFLSGAENDDGAEEIAGHPASHGQQFPGRVEQPDPRRRAGHMDTLAIRGEPNRVAG